MKHRLSNSLITMIILPVLVCLVLLLLLLFAYESAWDTVEKVQKQGIRELVDLGSSAVERLWIAPRNYAMTELSKSPSLRRHLTGELELEVLFREWAAAHRAMEGAFFIYYGLADGSIELYPDLELPEDFEPRERPWYRAGAASDGTPVWTSPYTEVITGETVVSTVVRLEDEEGRFIGVFSADITTKGLKEILNDINLPEGGEAFLLDQGGDPLVGTSDEYMEIERLNRRGEKVFLSSGSTLSNGWRLVVQVPRAALVAHFAELRRPLISLSVILFLLAALVLSGLVAKLGSRARRLADYFEEVIDADPPLRQLYRSEDEFSYLNRRFNRVIEQAREAEEERLSQERIFRLLLERAPIAFFKTWKNGTFQFVNDSFLKLLGYSREKILSLPSAEQLYHNGADRHNFIRALSRDNEVRDMRVRFVKKDGERIWVSITAMVSPGHEGNENFEIEGFIVDVTRDIAERENLLHLAETDPLTGLTNRRAFELHFHRIARQARERNQALSLLIFDIDHFKSVNDNYGHDVGDAILKQLADTGRSLVRKHDVFTRLGGDEFAVLLPEESEAAACALALRLQQQLAALDPPSPLNAFPTLSIGIASMVGGEIKLSPLLKRADTALYQAKERGRNRIIRSSDNGSCEGSPEID